MENKVEYLSKVGALFVMIEKCKELVQLEGIMGGHRSDIDDYLTTIQNDLYEELERIKSELRVN